MAIEFTIDPDKFLFRHNVALQKAVEKNDLQGQLDAIRDCVILPDGMVIDDLPARMMKKLSLALIQKMQEDDAGN